MSKSKRSLAFILIFSFLGLGTVYGANEEDRNKSVGTGVGRFVDLLLHDSGVAEALGKSGIRGKQASLIKRYVNNSLLALSSNGKKPSRTQLARILKQIPDSGKDGRIKKQLTILLNKSEKNLKKGDLVDAINNLMYLANRYGSGQATVLACAQCVSDTLYKNGFRFTMEVVSNKQSKKVLTKMLPTKPKDLKRFISSKLRSNGFGYSSKALRSQVAPEEEKSLALFLGLASSGSKTQKNFIEAVKDVSRNSKGKVSLLDPNNPHKLWKLFTDDVTDLELEGWTKLLKEVSQDARNSGEVGKKKAFFRYLERKASKEGIPSERVEVLKRKNCFFR